MTRIFKAHFDGKVILPDEPVQLPIGEPLRLHLELTEAPPRFADLLRFAADLPGCSARFGRSARPLFVWLS
jgi:hypothetical protein